MAWPAWVLALLLGGLALTATLGGAPDGPSSATAQGQDYDVLVFSRTTGFRHSESIAAGHAAIDDMAAAEGFSVTHSEEAGLFTNHGLRPFEVIVFLQTDGEGILNASQRTAFERWLQRGGGQVSIHADANADRDWDWKHEANGGALFQNHPAGANQFQEATVEIEDPSHPATASLPNPWIRTDEWYNFTAEPRGKVHVLLTLDETTYEEEDGSPGVADDHPIAWCSNYDGGRHFYTGLGHGPPGDHFDEPAYRDHILGAIQWAAGSAPGDCGPERPGLPTEASLRKVALDEGLANPMSLDVAEDGRVFFVELGSGFADSFPAEVRMYHPAMDETFVVGSVDVLRYNENGLTGIALDPDFETNNFVYLYYSVPGPQVQMGTQRLSRFTFDPEAGEVGMLDPASEVVLLEFPHQRLVCCHTAGSLAFDEAGNLYLSTGDDTEHSQSGGFAPIDDRQCGPGSWDAGDSNCNQPGPWPLDALHANDSRRTSGNTNDLRGKIIRVDPIESATPEDQPGIGSTYEIPAGNLFPPGTPQTRPEIYTMGHRNPFRFTIDPETGWIYAGEVGPDANPANDTGARGPRGHDEINQIRSAGNYGWPYCIADNKPYRPWNFATNQPAGDFFDCEGGPANTSPVNTGQATVPPAREAWIYYPYAPGATDFPDIPGGGGRTAIAGPVYHFDPALDSDVKLSEYFDDKLIWGDWSRDWLALTTIGPAGEYMGTEELMPSTTFRAPQDIELGADGAIYLLEWGFAFNYGGQFINADSGLYRIEQNYTEHPAVADVRVNRTSGEAPLEVEFTGEFSDQGDAEAPSYEWDFGDGQTSTEVNPVHTYTEPGTYTVTLTVTDSYGETTDTVVINVREPGGGNCVPLRSDSFEGADLDTEKWEVVRPDESRLSVANGSLNIHSAPLDIFADLTGMPNIVLQEIPGGGSEPWSITTELTWEPTQNFHNAGLIIYGDDSSYIKFGQVWNGSRQFEMWKELNDDPFADGGTFSGALPVEFPNRFFMRFTSTTGTDVEAQFSADGQEWTTLGTRTLAGISNPRIGVYATATIEPGVSQPTANFHEVTIEPDEEICTCTPLRSDEFDGDFLDTAKWTTVRNPAEYPPVVGGGNLTLPILNEVDGMATGPMSYVAQQVPDGDWTATTRVTIDLNDPAFDSWHQAGLILWQSDGNFIKTVFGRDFNNGNRRFEITSDNPTDVRQIGPSVVVDQSFPDTAWIRMIREGNTIRAEYAPDVAGEPGEFLPFGGTRPVDTNPPREGPGVLIGPAAGADITGGPYETTATFDFVRIEPDEQDCPDDTTPPETTASLDPPVPGPGGTYDGPVEVTLAAEDPGEGASGVASTEYRVNPEAVEPQTHDVQAQPASWDPNQIDATVGDQVTWHFDNPPAQFPHDVWLVPPGGNPDPAGPDIFEVTDGMVEPGGDPVSHTFDEQGSWQFICRVHSGYSAGEWSGMTGTVDVSGGGDGWTPYTEPFTLTADGDYVIEYRSTDVAGNVEDPPGEVSFTIATDVGEADLRLSASPGRESVRLGQRAMFTARVRNAGDSAAANVRVCVRAPTSKVNVVGKACVTRAGLAEGASMAPRFTLKPKRSARGRQVRITFTAVSQGLPTERDTATLRVRR